MGDLVYISGNKTVEKAGTSNTICGLVVSKNGSYAGVQIKGAMELPCSDPSMALGRQELVPDGSNGVKLADSGSKGLSALVVDIDTENSKLTAIL